MAKKYNGSYKQTVPAYLSGRSELDGCDAVAHQMERKWGMGRLRLLVDATTRERFDRQHHYLNEAIVMANLDEIREHAPKMARAWQALDRIATEAGHTTPSPDVWEVALEDGTVAAIVREGWEGQLVIADGRHTAVYTLAEVGRLLSACPGVAEVKKLFPGSTVTPWKRDPYQDPVRMAVDLIPF